MTAPAVPVAVPPEQLLWAVMRAFEVQALGQYDRYLPDLATSAKRAAVDEVERSAPADDVLARSELAAPIDALLATSASVRDPLGAAIVQGLVLERVRQVIYEAVSASERASERCRSTARAARAASIGCAAAAPARITALTAGADVFAAFAAASDEVLGQLDHVGEGVDRELGAHFDLRFADIVGGFVAELVPTCVALGMERRKVMAQLAGALMGL